ncbi:MAG: HDOD domain-containing protein [Spirochaetaceae bacterium]
MGRIFYSYFKEDDIENIIEGLENKNEYSCVLPYHNRVSELLIARVTSRLLKNVSQEKLNLRLSYIINKLVCNASKANIKRTYFTHNNLDINDEADYLKGLKEIDNSQYYNKYVETNNYKDDKISIKVSLSVVHNTLHLSIITNCALIQKEFECINESTEFANQFTNINQVFAKDPKISEKPGFGIVLIILMLKKIGISSKSISIESKDDQTVTTLSIPFEDVTDKKSLELSNELIKEINTLPQFPDSLLRLQQELEDPEWDYNRITDYILSDPSLTTEVLRLVNSPVYRLNDKIDKVSIAVKKIGIVGLNAILYNYGMLKSLESRYNLKKINYYKEHLFQVALISSYLAHFRKLDDFSEDIYVAALMHDIGKIVVNSLNSTLSDKLNKICLDRKIPTDVLDNLVEGLNHSIIGSKLTQKWDFPSKYVNAILYHHRPLEVPEQYRIITFCVYLGNEITLYLDGESKYSSMCSSVLEYFNLETSDKFNNFVDKIKTEGLYINI